MLLAINIIFIISLFFVVYQDIKHRAMHIILPIILFAIGIAQFLFMKHDILELIMTISFLTFVFLGLFIYMSVKSKKIINPIDSSIGLGDIVFFIAITPFFFSTTYIIFFTTGMIFSILCHFVFNRRKELHVPLAGYLSIYLLLFIALNYYTTNELFYTHQII